MNSIRNRAEKIVKSKRIYNGYRRGICAHIEHKALFLSVGIGNKLAQSIEKLMIL